MQASLDTLSTQRFDAGVRAFVRDLNVVLEHVIDTATRATELESPGAVMAIATVTRWALESTSENRESDRDVRYAAEQLRIAIHASGFEPSPAGSPAERPGRVS